MQLDLGLATPRRPSAAREQGEAAANACVEKAERVAQFDADGARTFVLSWLRRHGEQSGEELVRQAKAHGFFGHDDRCFGSVFSTLSRQGLIRCLRSDLPRERGHGTSGGKLWRASP